MRFLPVPLGLVAPLWAQGVTTAAMQGTVTRTDDTPVAAATVEVVSHTTGARWRLVTGGDGRFAIEHVPIGGPYAIEVRALGFAPQRQTGIRLAVGELFVAPFVLHPIAIEIEAVTVSAQHEPPPGPGHGGPTTVVSAADAARTPSAARDLTTLALLSPHVAGRPGGGIAVAGQNQAYNAFQIDGGVNGDRYFGREPGGPGAIPGLPQVLPRTIGLDAVQELQVLVAPFDVRYGGFAGGLVNVVTRSGGNTSHGSAFSYFQNQTLAGPDPAGEPSPDFTSWDYGATWSGPIVRDRIHYLVAAHIQRQAVPDPGPLVADTAGGADTARTGLSLASADRFRTILAKTYGLDAGSLGPTDGRTPAQDAFGKVTAQLHAGSRLELSYHYAHGNRRDFVVRRFGTYRLSSTAEENRSTTHTVRAIWHLLIGGRWANELIVGYLEIRDECRPNGSFPLIEAAADNGSLLAGSSLSCPTTRIAQETLEFTDNVTVSVGRHRVTVGTHSELLHFRDPILLTSAGLWRFASLDSLELGLAYHYERGLPGPLRPEGPVADFRVRQIGLYVQDRWTLTPRLGVAAGIRFDVPLLPDDAATNPALKGALGFDTGRLPSGNALWSPRLAFSYELGEDGRGLVRGGAGLFNGPPPYFWIGNAYRDSGADQLQLTCDGAAVPPFDPLNQPSSCLTGSATAVPRISFFDPEFRFPQNLKLSLGLDHRLLGATAASVDLVYTRAVRQVYFTDANLGGPIGAAAGEGQRPLYGTIDSSGTARPVRRDPSFGQVVRVDNRSGDQALTLAFELRRRLAGAIEFTAFYAYSRARDLMSLINLQARPNLQNTPLDGTMEERQPRTSFFETPHRVALLATLPLPLRSRLSLHYTGAPQTPFTYVVNGDANADGIGRGGVTRNDAVYVPRSATPGGDISLVVRDSLGRLVPAPAAEYATLDRFIEAHRCLREQRGRVMRRNSCRNGWLSSFNARIMMTVPTADDQALEVVLDVFNLLNLVNPRWGRSRYTTTEPSVQLLDLVGWDGSAGRGVYRLRPQGAQQYHDAASRWQLQLGARYRL